MASPSWSRKISNNYKKKNFVRAWIDRSWGWSIDLYVWNPDSGFWCYGSIDTLVVWLIHVLFYTCFVSSPYWTVFSKMNIIWDLTIGIASNHLELKGNIFIYLESKFKHDPLMGCYSSYVKLLTLGSYPIFKMVILHHFCPFCPYYL